MKIQVLNASAQRLPFKIALLRYLIYSLTPAAATIVSTLLIKTGNVILVLPGMAILLASIAVMFMPGYTKYKQGLHDKLLKTYVIYRF